MMTLHVAYLIICVWAAWCVLSDHVRDGLIGKLIYSVMSITAYSAIACQHHESTRQDAIILACLAVLGLRHFLMKQIKSLLAHHHKR